GKQSLMIQRLKQGAAVRKRPQAIEAHRVQALEDVTVFAMLRRTPVLLRETLDVLETGDDALFAGRPRDLLLGRRELGKLCRKVVQIGVIHSAPPPGTA